MSDELTPKQALFVDEYLIDLNATRAAIRAGYSEQSAKEIGCENLTKPNIQEKIAERMADRQKRTEITQDMVLEGLAKVAFADLRLAFDDKGGLIPIHEMPDEVAATLAGFEHNKISGLVKFKTNDRMKGLELLGRHLAMFTDVSQSTHTVEMANSDEPMSDDDWEAQNAHGD